MNVEEISKKVTQQVREDICYVYDINKTYNSQFSKHKPESIEYMFKECIIYFHNKNKILVVHLVEMLW